MQEQGTRITYHWQEMQVGPLSKWESFSDTWNITECVAVAVSSQWWGAWKWVSRVYNCVTCKLLLPRKRRWSNSLREALQYALRLVKWMIKGISLLLTSQLVLIFPVRQYHVISGVPKQFCCFFFFLVVEKPAEEEFYLFLYILYQ